MRKFLVAILSYAFLTTAALAQLNGGFMFPGPGMPASAGGGPVFSGATSGSNGACGFATTCSVTSVTVPAGFIVAGAGGGNNAGGASTVSAISVCGTALTAAVNPSAASGQYMIGEFYGTTAGGTCTVQVTASGAGAWDKMGIALAGVSGLTSSTPGTGCSATFASSQASPYPCSSSITVSSGGFGIAVFGATALLTLSQGSSSVVVDSQTAANLSFGIGHSSVAGTLTPDFATSGFQSVGIAAAPWR